MFPFTHTGSGESVLLTARSAPPVTDVVAVPVLLLEFPSGTALAAVAEFVIVVPLGVFALTFTTIEKTAVSPLTTVGLENTTLPVPPTAGDVIAHPVPAVTEDDTKVVLAGTASLTFTEVAVLGPLFVKLMVYVRF